MIGTEGDSGRRSSGRTAPGKTRRRDRRSVNGLLLLDKPVGMTSNQALQRVKKLFSARKAGHTGSLDPLASGMLPICFGQATKISSHLLGADKLYRVRAQFGEQTDTADADGAVVARADLTRLGREELEHALADFRGELQQIPPMYSALKRDGKRLYELAREGKQVEREPRRIHIRELQIEHYDPERPVLRVLCSKGTYVRTLIEDIARAAGTLGHVVALRRLAVVPFDEQGLVTMNAVAAAADDGQAALDALLRPVDQAIAHWPSVRLNENESYYLLQGHPVSRGQLAGSGQVRLYDDRQRFLGIGEILADGRVAPKRLFIERPQPGSI